MIITGSSAQCSARGGSGRRGMAPGGIIMKNCRIWGSKESNFVETLIFVVQNNSDNAHTGQSRRQVFFCYKVESPGCKCLLF